MFMVDGMPEESSLQMLSTSSIILLPPLSILDTKLLGEQAISCDTMSGSLKMSLFLSILGRFRISFLTPLFLGN